MCNPNIEPIYDYSDDELIYYAAAGHVEPCQFATSLMDQFGYCSDITGIKHGDVSNIIDPEFKKYLPDFCLTSLVTYVEL